MFRALRRSLLLRAGFTVLVVALLALSSMVTSMYVAWQIEGDAAAINYAGSVRMAAYRLALHMQQDAAPALLAQDRAGLAQRLEHPALRAAVPDYAESALRQQYEGLRQQWTQLEQGLQGPAAKRWFATQVDAFVAHVDDFVVELQRQSERKNQMHRLVQGIIMLTSLFVLAFGMYMILADVLGPLRELMSAADRTRGGDFSARVSYEGEDELGLLGRSFNRMTDAIASSHAALEKRVAEKTAQLRNSNEALSMLYDISRELTGERFDREKILPWLQRLERTLGDCHINLRLFSVEGRRLSDVLRTEAPAPDRRLLLSLDVRDGERVYGCLDYYASASKAVSHWQQDLLYALAENLGRGFALFQRNEQQRLLALMEERAVIARELHDSLAQSLSYLKIQVSRMQMLQAQGEHEALRAVIDDLRQGLNSAYRQLRELLTTFRLSMSEQGLHAALDAAIAEFSARGNISIELDYSLHAGQLNAHEEIHLLQIVRESLSNIVNHADARGAQVRLQPLADGSIELCVSDNGKGFPANPERYMHHGMAIIRERASSLGGQVELANQTQGGAMVRLCFHPQRQGMSSPAPQQEL